VIDGEDVVHEVVLPAPPERVFDMFVDPVQLVRWLGISADLEPSPGGRFRFEVVPGRFCEGAYVEVDRPRRVVVTWGWSDPAMGVPPGSSRVEIDLDDLGDATRLRLVHRLPPEAGLLHDDGWSRFLARLHEVVAGRDAGDYPDDDPAARLARLREERPGR
jgi:uncharacterized protein YndB with AHSA1/START domain